MQTKVVAWLIFIPLVAPYPPYRTDSGDQYHGLPDHYGHQDHSGVVVKGKSDHHDYNQRHNESPFYVNGNLGNPSNYHGTRSYAGYGEDDVHHDYLSHQHDNDQRYQHRDNYGSFSEHSDYHGTQGYYGDHFAENPGRYHFDHEDIDDDDDDHDDHDDGYEGYYPGSLDDFRR